ncbi:MAG: hypothetical protein A4E28_00920 [Methanocella sp. PtaU1.Bin125]|nr:MAG: hypothetical protein A4E28_00920 [Methanocella sp. PtaU1.Bin125]
MISESSAGISEAEAVGPCMAASRQPGMFFPVDRRVETSIDQLTVRVYAAYIVDLADIESVRCAGYGRHHIYGNRQAVVLESGDRLYVTPGEDCMLEFTPGKARLIMQGKGSKTVSVGIRRKPVCTVATGPDTESLFRCISALCAVRDKISPWRSHPFFRPDLPDISLLPAGTSVRHEQAVSPIAFRLPPDLRYLYAMAPLSCYLGASVGVGDTPSVSIRGEIIDLPAGYRQFERWAGRMLSRSFQADCAARYASTPGRQLAGIDLQAILGYAPEELMLMGMPDRFRLYMERLRSAGRAFNAPHTAAYVDPVPSSVELMPYLMRSLSAVYAPAGSPVTERDVVSLSVRDYRARRTPVTRGGTDTAETVLLPSLYGAQSQLWFSGGCPVDAALSSIGALKNGRKHGRDRTKPEVCIICNEPPMLKESLLIQRQLERIATIEVRANLGCRDLLHTLSEGFDVLHYAGHSERAGLKCPDGYADLSRAEENNVPFFFLNCCSSYIQGTRLIEKGSVCGIATLFRVIDEAALDVCAGFYRMLAYGYPVMTSYLGARECSVTGREYLMIGDGYHNVFNARGVALPFYRLRRNGRRFTLHCHMSGSEKGLIIGTGSGCAIPDTGFQLSGLHASDLPDECNRMDGMCLYSGSLYDSVAAAVNSALSDLRRMVTQRRCKTNVPS